MQTKFQLSQQEVQEAVQIFIAKKNRTKNLRVSAIEQIGNDIVATAEVVVTPRAPRKTAAKTVAKKAVSA
jgi:hypothetical protein